MTNILELLKNEKVEWKKLGEVIDYEQPTKYIVTNTNYNDDYDIPVLTAGQTFILGYTNEKEGIYKATINEPVIIFDDFTTSNHWVDFSFKIKSSAMKILKPKQGIITFRYCYHYMKTINIDITEHKRMWISKLSNIEIPIPSLETQEKIVEILDKFTNYVTELQSELQSRTKQYTYYRDKLLSEEYLTKVTKEMEEDRRLDIVQLEEVVTIKNGKDWKKLGQGNIPVYGSGGEMGVFVDKYSYDKPTVLIPRKGSIDNVFYLDKPFWNVDTIFHTEIDQNKLIPKYFYYFIEYYDLNKLSDNSTRPSLTQSTLNKLKLPLPPLSLQNKIVKVLDKFQVLLADTKGLLPAEIEKRQKQYEYYREKLLTFDVEYSSTHARTSIISNNYYNILQEVANIVEVDIEDKIEWKNLEDVFYTRNGYTPSKKIKEFWDNGSVPWFRMEDIRTNGSILYDSLLHVTESAVKNGVLFKENSIILATSATIGEHALIKVPFLSNQRFTCFTRKREEELNIKFMYYYFYILDEWCKTNVSIGSFPSIDVSKLLLKKIPILPLHVQQHIVSILDKFDTLVNDIKEGLPKEIEQRQQQYEYWRECLLNFPR